MTRALRALVYSGKRGRSRRVADNEAERGYARAWAPGNTTTGSTLYARAEAHARRGEAIESEGWQEHGALLIPSLGAAEAAQGRAERALAEPIEVEECSWCGELWACEDLHDLADFRAGGVVLVCEVCDSTGGF